MWTGKMADICAQTQEGGGATFAKSVFLLMMRTENQWSLRLAEPQHLAHKGEKTA